MNNIVNTLTRLEEIKVSHPEIYLLWREYIIKKIVNLSKSIESCNTVLNYIDETNVNVTANTVLFFMMYNNIINNSNDLNES
jgi:ACR3 family arsenite efflux pump ArsB